ncbi:MAG TPA: amino acid ABC transporter permease, partial [Actinopolymorphaceae bacterium]
MEWFDDLLVPLLGGLPTTLLLTVFGGLAALVMAFVAGMLRLSKWAWVRGATRVYVEFFRGTSLLVQLFWIFFAFPQLTGYRLDPMFAAIITFGLSYGAYGSEVVRGSILAVPKAQWEATTACNMSNVDRMRRVILPQAIPIMLPSFANLLIELLKGT